MRSNKELASFVAYCAKHPQLRFWQALRNWAGYGFIYVSNSVTPDEVPKGVHDTFYWEETKKDVANDVDAST